MPSRIRSWARSGVTSGREAVADQFVDGELLQRQIEEHGLVLQEVEAVPRGACPALQVDQVELFAQLDVVARRKIEPRRSLSAAAHFEVGRIVHADRRVGVRQIRDQGLDGQHLRLQAIVLGLGDVLLFAQTPPLFLPPFAFGRLFGLADGLGDFVGVPVEFLHFLQLLAPAALQGDRRSMSG